MQAIAEGRDGLGPLPLKYVSSQQAATYLQLSEQFLEKLRVVGGGPIFSKISAGSAGRGRILYSIDDLDAFMAARRQRSTSDVRVGAAA